MVEIFENIRQVYTFHPPCQELADYIEFFSESSPDATRAAFGGAAFSIKMFPSWTPTMWFNLQSPYTIVMGTNRYVIPSNTHVLIVRDMNVERLNLPTDHIFSIKFFPGALEAILDVDQSTMTGVITDLRHLLTDSLIASLMQSNNLESRAEIMQQFFLARLKTRKRRDHIIRSVREVITSYETGRMQPNIAELSARFFTTTKTINRHFHQAIGSTPKVYLSVLRARTALTAFIRQRNSFSPTAFGYHDMSHFYKDAAKFTGQKISVHRQ